MSLTGGKWQRKGTTDFQVDVTKATGAQLCLRAAAVFLPPFFSSKNEKYCAAVASVSWLTDAAYPLRVHTVFLRFPNFELSQKSRLGLLAKLCGVAKNFFRDFS